MPLRPGSMFACGCSLQFGVMAILIFHLVTCLLYLGATFSSIVLHISPFGAVASWGPVLQFCMIGFNMCGFPIIIVAIYGALKRNAMAIRPYLLYLLITFLVDTVVLVDVLLVKDSCSTPGSFVNAATAAGVGTAFMCGFLRILSYSCVSLGVFIEVYCVFIVWSFCEDVYEGSSGPELWELLATKEEAFKKKHEYMIGEREGPYADIVGMAYYSKLPGAYPSAYGSLESYDSGLVGNTFFGGQCHEMNFPPSPEYSRW